MTSLFSIIPNVKKIKVNFFDLVVISILAIIISVFFFIRVTKKTEWVTVRLVIANDEWAYEGQPPQWWYVDNLQTGQAAYNSLGEKIAEISNVDSFDVGGYKRRAFIDIKLKGSFDKNRKIYLYNFQPLQIGKPLDLTFGKNNVKGLISYIDNLPPQYSERKIEVKLFARRPWVASSLRTGLEMKDSLGRVLAKIDKSESVVSSYYEFSDIRGQKILVLDPNFSDITVNLTVKTFQSGGNEFFVDRAALKIGEKIWFQFPNVAISDAEITKIFD